MSTKLQHYKEYKRFRITLMGDKHYMEITAEDKEKIMKSIMGGAKFISLGNIFFAVSSLSSILPISPTSGEVAYMPNNQVDSGYEKLTSESTSK